MKTSILRECKYCGVKAINEVELELFIKEPKSKYGRTKCCKECRRKQYKQYDEKRKMTKKEWAKEYYKKNKDKYQKSSRELANVFYGLKGRERHYMRKYGITLEDYNNMLKEQNGVCKICNQCEIDNSRLAVDHCHITGNVRGLLCGKCNRGLGFFADSTKLLHNAIEYLNDNKD